MSYDAVESTSERTPPVPPYDWDALKRRPDRGIGRLMKVARRIDPAASGDCEDWLDLWDAVSRIVCSLNDGGALPVDPDPDVDGVRELYERLNTSGSLSRKVASDTGPAWRVFVDWLRKQPPRAEPPQTQDPTS